jgi:hypothetical protein
MIIRGKNNKNPTGRLFLPHFIVCCYGNYMKLKIVFKHFYCTFKCNNYRCLHSVCNTSIPLLACIERYLFDDILTFYINQHKADVKLSMREKRKSYFRVNVKNKAPWDTKNANSPLILKNHCFTTVPFTNYISMKIALVFYDYS